MMKKFLSWMKPWLLRLLIIPPIIAGIVVLAIAIQNRKAPEKVVQSEVPRVLRVISVPKTTYVPRAIGFGSSRPAQVWKAVAEVKGRIVQLNPDLRPGSFIQANTPLVKIDATDIETAIERLNNEIAKSNAGLLELKAQSKNYEATLALENQSLQVVEQELARAEKLFQSNAGSATDVDTQKRAVISQRRAVQSVQSSLNLLPSQIATAEANIAVAKSNLATEQRNLERVDIKAPFDCRIGPVELELDQFVAAGETLFDAQATRAFEVEAQVSVGDLRKLFDIAKRREDLQGSQPPGAITQESFKKYFDTEVIVRYEAGGQQATRKATFERIREELDAQTRTSGVVVTIAKPFAETNISPPPVSGTYCEVEFRGKPQADKVIVPRNAIRNGNVYVLDSENRLQRRTVEILTTQAEFAIIESGLSGGEVLVVSDPTPAVVGILVEPKKDLETEQLIIGQANGDGELR